MSRKMAVRNKKNQSEKRSKRLDFSVLKFMKPGLNVSIIFFFLSGLLFLVMKTPSLWSGIWPIEKIAFLKPINYIEKEELAMLVKSNNMGSMLSIDLHRLREKILQNPWVQDVSIRKKWPDTLVFDFYEHKPIAVVNNQYLIESGYLMEKKVNKAALDVMKIDFEENPKKNLLELLELVKELEYVQKQLEINQFNVERFVVDQSKNCAIEIKNKFIVKMGRKHRKERIERFLKVYSAIENKKNLQSIDLRYRNGLAVKLAQTEISAKKQG